MLSFGLFSLSSTSDIASDPQFPQFERFIRQHRGGTPYGSEAETIARFTIFKDTLATIDARNAVGKTPGEVAAENGHASALRRFLEK